MLVCSLSMLSFVKLTDYCDMKVNPNRQRKCSLYLTCIYLNMLRKNKENAFHEILEDKNKECICRIKVMLYKNSK